MNETVRERILQHVEKTLAAIQVGEGYANTLEKYGRTRTTPLELKEFPSAFIYEGPEDSEHGPTPFTTRKLKIVLQGWVQSNDGDLSVKVNSLLGDIQKAMMVDATRGGLAVDTRELDNDTYIEQGDPALGAAYLMYEIHYRTLREDPTRQ